MAPVRIERECLALFRHNRLGGSGARFPVQGRDMHVSDEHQRCLGRLHALPDLAGIEQVFPRIGSRGRGVHIRNAVFNALVRQCAEILQVLTP